MKLSSIFNINGNIGSGAYGIPEFNEAADLLAQMDYLEVDRSLVWHTPARDMNPTAGNKSLLEVLAADEEIQQRLIPAFVITPADYFEYGALDFLKSSLRDKQVKALYMFPGSSRFYIGEIERLMNEIAEFEPVVFWKFTDSNGRSDQTELINLAQKFPKVTFVLTELMWPQFSKAVDLMWRAENICIDTSWLHMRDTIKLLCDEFGAERVLLGVGYKAHYGAAIADLCHASISDAEKELIAHGNIERLLGLKPLGKSLFSNVAILDDKPFWNAFKEGRVVEQIDIIDAHAHCGATARGWIIRDSDVDENLQNLVKQMDRCGVSRTIVAPEVSLFGEPLDGNRIAEEQLQSYKERFNGYFVFNPIYKDTLVPVLDDFFSRSFYIGFKVLSSYWKVPLQDDRYTPMWEYADKYHLPILLHTWDDRYNSPRFLEDIAPKYPNAKFLLGHSGGGTSGRAEAVELANSNSNVFLEFCGSFTTPADWVDTIAQVGIEKVIFGSDTGAHSLAWELGRFLSIPLADEQLRPALAENFERILSERKKK